MTNFQTQFLLYVHVIPDIFNQDLPNISGITDISRHMSSYKPI